MVPEILFLNISVNYCPQLIKFHSGIDTENLYKISEADLDLIQKADFIAICMGELLWLAEVCAL